MYIEIKTERLTLRPMNISDLEIVHEYASDKENTKYLRFGPNESVEETTIFLSSVTKEWEKDQPDFYEFAIVLDGKQIGAVCIYLDEKQECGEFGWILNKKYWGSGYAAEAALALKDYVVGELKVKKLIAHCDARNTASARVMEKIGLKLESDDGIRVYFKRNETARELMYALDV
ncbi:MAG: GNAT family N-acetyltransferase [Oscillospiraceae bacterium]|nr:GNAT family N-acetyltransferase [Oscillospiraceae bacterium]